MVGLAASIGLRARADDFVDQAFDNTLAGHIVNSMSNIEDVNTGDANTDGVPDKNQSSVMSFLLQTPGTGTRMTFVSSGCTDTA
ncbi:hypothetical protein IT415_01760 [bacterium]|nr:hypothetical protein [bacterium]